MFGILGLGFLLGMQHALEADHIAAVSSIAARRTEMGDIVKHGLTWGLGHTLMLFVVGAGIILFNWSVPPRLGLAMEFCVALALVVVGLLNLGRLPRRESDLQGGAGRPPASCWWASARMCCGGYGAIACISTRMRMVTASSICISTVMPAKAHPMSGRRIRMCTAFAGARCWSA